MERIASLSPEAREAYRRTFGPVAEEALAAALRTRDPAALAALGDRYLLAGPAGPRALLALADLRLARGEPGLAVAPLRELLRRFPGSPEGGPAVAARLARALARIRDHDGLEALRSSPALPPGAAVRAGGVEVPLSRILEEAAAEAGPRRGGGDAATLGGGPSRSGAGAAVPPLGAPRWIEGSPRFNWTDTDFRQINRETSVEQAVKASQPVVPCIVDGVVFFHWQGDVHARDLYTGKERWHFRGPEIPRLESARTHASWLASPTVKDGVLYAGLMAWPLGERVRTIYFAGQDIIPYLPTRRLFALDAGTGALLWSHADPRPAGDPFADRLSRLNATAAPLVLGDLVISAGAAYRSQFEAAAFAADRRTGEVRWVTPLGFGQQEQNLFGRPVKEVAVAAVASDGDRVFVQTNMGLLSCLEASTGRPLWTRGYRQVEIPYYQTFWTTPEREFTFTGSPPVVSGGVVVVAPADGASVLAFEAATGKFLWSAPGRDGRRSSDPRMTRLLGADGDCAYLAGTGVRALELRTGRLAWDQPFDTRHQEECSGRGVLSGGLLHVPTNRALWVLEARGAGRVVRKDPWVRADGEVAGRAGGNLVTAEGAAVIARLYQMEGHFSAENVAARVAALLAERPEDPSALLEAARAYLAADRHEAALPLLRRALAGAAALPPGERERMEVQVRTGIFAVLETRASALSAAGKPEEAQRAFAEAARNAADPADAAGVLLRGARLLQDADRFDLAAPLVEAVVRDTLRRARSPGLFVRRATAALGHPVEVISGIEEARLIYVGASHYLPRVNGPQLIVDIGGGSTEIVAGRGLQPELMESLAMGCVGLTEACFPDGRLSMRSFHKARLQARLELEPVRAQFRRIEPVLVAGTSGTIRAAESVLAAAGRTGITVEGLEWLIGQMANAGRIDNLRLQSLSSDRAVSFAGGIAILIEVMDAIGLQRMTVADGALREGILYDMVGRLTDEDARTRTVRAMAGRYHVDRDQAGRVRATALKMLESVAKSWSLETEADREMLDWAASLHELGLDIAHAPPISTIPGSAPTATRWR